MQTITGYPSDLTSATPTVQVTHNGVVRKASSVSVARELPSNLPVQVAGGSGITAATGSVTWAEPSETAPHPWVSGAFPPKAFDRVTVDSGYGTAMVRLLTGRVDGSSGSLADGSVSSPVVDGIDRLNKTVSIEPLLAIMPPLNAGGLYRFISITPTYYTDRILRACGFYATPAPENGNVVSAPLQGSSWPERGALLESSNADTTNGGTGTPSWVTAPWGQSAYSLSARYRPAFTPSYDGRLNQAMQISFCLDPTYQGGVEGGSITAWWAADYVRAAVSTSGAVIAQIRKGGVVTEACRLVIGSSKVFSLRVAPDGVFTLRSDDGREATGTIPVSAEQATTPMESFQVFTGHQAKYPLGGVQLSFTSVFSAVNHVQTAFMTPAAYRFSLEASPAIENSNALALLKEQSEAECAAMWLDEYGNFQWVNRDMLTPSGPPAESITALTGIEDLGWEHNAGSVRSRVEVSYEAPGSALPSRWVNLVAHQGSGESMESGQQRVEFVSPPSDTDWIVLDTTPSRLGDAGTTVPFNRGWGSHYGATVANDTVDRLASAAEITVSVQRLGVSTLKVTTTAGAVPSDSTLEMRAPKAVSGVWPKWAEENLLILRCMHITEWKQYTATGATLGPPDAPVLTHDTKWWVHRDGVQALADWLSAQVSAPQPTIRELSVIPDDRRQLGDIVQVEFDTVALRCLVTGISNSTSISGNEISKDQSLTVRVLSVTAGTTNAQMDAAYASTTNTQFDALWAGATNASLDADPLQKA